MSPPGNGAIVGEGEAERLADGLPVGLADADAFSEDDDEDATGEAHGDAFRDTDGLGSTERGDGLGDGVEDGSGTGDEETRGNESGNERGSGDTANRADEGSGESSADVGRIVGVLWHGPFEQVQPGLGVQTQVGHQLTR